MSLIEKDLFRWFWELPPWATALTVILAGPVMLYIIEIIRWQFGPYPKPPWGLNLSRYMGVWIGDLIFMSLAIGVLTVWYDRVRVDESFWTSRTFSVLCLVGGIALAALFIYLEEKGNAYPGDKWNLNRLWHTPYMVFYLTLLLGATRVIGYGVIKGHERGLAALALALVICLITSFAMDQFKLNFVWEMVKRKWPDKTAYP